MAYFYPLMALLTLAVGQMVSLWGYGTAYIVPWYMFTVAILASLYGLLWGVLVALVLALLLPSAEIVAGVVLFLSAWLAHGVGESLRRAHRRAKALAKSQRLLAESLKNLSQASSREEILKSLPARLSPLTEQGHLGVWLPVREGFRLLKANVPMKLVQIPASGVIGRAFRQGRPVYIPDVRKEPGYIPDPDIPTRSELALPLLEKGEVVAVLNLESRRLLLPEEVEGLIRLAQAISGELTRLADFWIQRTLTDLGLRLQAFRGMGEVAQGALAYLLQALGLEAGAVWEVQGGRMVPLAYQGPEVLRLPELPYGQGLAWRVYQSGEPFYTSRYLEEEGGAPAHRAQGLSALAALPLPSLGALRTRRVLVLASLAPRSWTRTEREALGLSARFLGLALEGLAEKARHQAVGELFLALGEAQPELEGLYGRLLEAALRWVSGSEVGSLLILQEGHYRYKAVRGYDLVALQKVYFTPEEMLKWYAQGPDRALRGEPRILKGVEAPVAEISYQTAPREVMDSAGRVQEIQANLCLPIPYQGRVLAYLNLDNLHDPQAFGEDSLEAAHFFAPPLAVFLHEADARKRLETAALTDPLTGLLNRRAFERLFQEELSRARRYNHPLSIFILDLTGFKALNDRLGHVQGDRALIQVGRVLQEESREGDKIFRWGGDEFAVLLPHTSRRGAVQVALRYIQAIQAICLEGFSLGVNIGLATYPEDGDDPDTLLSRADTRMYRAKALGISILGEGVAE
ncbi:sensor domain-containing diguanylate cyclase [Meiothermus rufus]|uniref:sensor domain-containing diguanylate cyclase n=1 Tax=Meiothermus rufus TaxID=604332 RepID=UPI0004853217|nr:diguanylate cyclase [Meiothermus rufus]